MFNIISKFLPPRQLRIPLAGLLFVSGVVAVGGVRPVVSSQIEYLSKLTHDGYGHQAETHTWLQRNYSSSLESAPQKEARLRKALTKSVASSKVADSRMETYTWLQRNSLEQSVPHRQERAVQNSVQTSSAILVNKLKARHNNRTLVATQTLAAPKTKFPTQNGVYLYGQSPKAGQQGQGYIIFEKQQNSLVGALYMPSSEFSCFNGTLSQSGNLAMTVTGYPGEGSATQVATSNLTSFSEDGPTSYSHSVALNNYYQLNTVSANDRQILQMCKSHH
ncbi:MAG: hypothetical protein PUP93_27245 [Rhizonema sp. NSF051]|nr:hypothetical protein [Rhizonema sp. NSF051]